MYFYIVMKKWLITDTHWNHKNIIAYENRPLNYNELIIENCRAMISDEDEVYHLGDVIFARKGELEGILEQIPGKKFLTLGNHDGNAAWYKKKGFDVVNRHLIVDNVLLSHRPKEIDPFIPMGVEYMIHGHFHRKDRKELDRTPEFYPFYKKGIYFNLSIEEMDYKPITIEDFLQLKLNELNNV